LLAEDDAFEAHLQARESRFDASASVVWSRRAELITHAATLLVARGTFYAEDVADRSRCCLAGGPRGFRAELEEEALQCRLLREIAGSPFRPVTVEPAWRLYNEGAAWQMARWIHQQRDFDSQAGSTV